MNNETLTRIPGLLVGHYTDEQARTGCTAILCREGAVAGVDVRGSAPGTRETDLLRGYNLVERVNAIMLSGGSAFGLDAASGAMAYLEEQGWGMDVGPTVVPIVPGAVIFDLGVGDSKVRPGRAEGYAACQAASDAPVAQGLVGAGHRGHHRQSLRPGICQARRRRQLLPFPGGGRAGGGPGGGERPGGRLRPGNREPIGAAVLDGQPTPCLTSPALGQAGFGNTTIGVVATNAKLTREEANKLASMGHDGLAMGHSARAHQHGWRYPVWPGYRARWRLPSCRCWWQGPGRRRWLWYRPFAMEAGRYDPGNGHRCDRGGQDPEGSRKGFVLPGGVHPRGASLFAGPWQRPLPDGRLVRRQGGGEQGAGHGVFSGDRPKGYRNLPPGERARPMRCCMGRRKNGERSWAAGSM